MVIPRTVLRRKTQYLVALPREVRDLLKLRGGTVVYWHAWRDGEVVLTQRSTRKGGKPPRVDLERELRQAHAQIDTLNRQLEEAPHRARNQAWFELAQKGMKLQLTGLPVIGAIHARLAAIEGLLEEKRPGRSLRVQRPVRGRRRTETIPAPILSPPDSERGGVGAGAASPRPTLEESPTHAP